MNDSKSQFQALIVCLLMFFSSLAIAQDLTNKMDSVSYSLGLVLGQNFKKDGFKNLNSDLVARALTESLEGKESLISDIDAKRMYSDYTMSMAEEKKMAVKADGEAYLAKNKTNPKVVTTASGLQYEVLVEGKGPKPTANDKVKTHYHGMLIDGTVFDSSVDRGKPITFPVMGVIKGWQEALQLMNVGSKYRLTIPQELAYGARGAGASIPPYATLVFEVELLGIE